MRANCFCSPRHFMMTSSNGSISHVTDPLWGETTNRRWIPLTKSNDSEPWCFLWSAPEETVEQTIETPVMWEAIAPITAPLMLSPKGSQTITPGGGTQSGFIRGCAAPGSEPLPYFRENRTPKTYPILGKSHNPRHPKRAGLQKHNLF